MSESASGTTLPAASSIEDSGGAVWTLRMSDRAVLRNGSTTSLSGVIELQYLNHVVWAYMGSGWKSYSGSWSATSDWRTKPASFPTTAGLRRVIGPQVLASYTGVQLTTASDVHAVVAANPAGTTYVFAIGTYPNQWCEPKDGDTFIGLYDGVNGAILDGLNTGGAAFFSSGAYVTVKNLIITKYIPGLQHGQVEVIGDFCTIQNCEISYSTYGGGAGVYLSQKALVIDCDIHHNNQQGFTVHGDIMGYVAQVGVTLDNNKIRDNNPTEAEWSGSEQGGGKALETQYFSAWFNEIHGNGGSGIWMDSNNIWITIWANKFNGYGWNGVEIEISYDFQVRHNDFSEFVAPQGSGYFSEAAVMIGNSGGVDTSNESDISENIFATTAHTRLVAARQQNRILGDRYNIGVIRYVRNIYVHDNTIAMTGTTTVWDAVIGLQWDYDPDGVVHGANKMRFDYNHYTVDATFTAMWSIGGNLTNRTFAQWQAVGQDLNGTIIQPPAPPPAWDLAFKNSRVTISGGANKIATGVSGGSQSSSGRANESTRIEAGQKRYWIVTINAGVGGGLQPGVGIATESQTYGNDEYLGNSVNSVGYFSSGVLYWDVSLQDTLAPFANGDRIYIVVQGNYLVWFGKNAFPDTGGTTNSFNIFNRGAFYPAYNTEQGAIFAVNFGPLPIVNGFSPFILEKSSGGGDGSGSGGSGSGSGSIDASSTDHFYIVQTFQMGFPDEDDDYYVIGR